MKQTDFPDTQYSTKYSILQQLFSVENEM